MTALFFGAARASIAPRPEDFAEGVYLGGFGSYRSRRATAVHDEPQCRALAMSDGQSAVVIAVLDMVGASGPLLAEIRNDASRLTGIDAASIIVCCTHSHASPDLQGLWGGVPGPYRTHIVHRAASAIWEAWEARVPVSLVAASSTLSSGVRNRRAWPETDTSLTALRFVGEDGSTRGTLVNYACHPTAIGRESTDVSRDWCGFAIDAVEESIGGVALYVNGAIGDVVPATESGFTAAQSLGESVASAALTTLISGERVAGEIDLRMRTLELPLNFERLSKRVQDAAARVTPAVSVLARSGGLHAASLALHAAGRADVAQIVAAFDGIVERRLVQRDGQSYIVTACGYLGLGGDVEMLIAPGEVLTRLALPLRAALGAPHRLILGLAQDTLGYFVPEDEWMTGRNNNYEESVSMGKHGGTVLADALLALIPHRTASA